MEINKDSIINEFINKHKNTMDITGCLICGSYITGGYNFNSDIDVLLLSTNNSFEMILENYQDTLFDRMIVDPKILENILLGKSLLSNILSLSFGLDQKVIINSNEIVKIITIAKRNIINRKLEYKRSENKPKKVIDGIPYLLKQVDDKYYLVKNGIIVC